MKKPPFCRLFLLLLGVLLLSSCQQKVPTEGSSKSVESGAESTKEPVAKTASNGSTEASTSTLLDPEAPNVVSKLYNGDLLANDDSRELNSANSKTVEVAIQDSRPWTIARIKEEFPKGTVLDFSQEVLTAEFKNSIELIECGPRPVQGPEFTDCLHMDITQPPTNMYGLSLPFYHDLKEPKKDDILLVAMYYRSISTTDESGVGKFHLQYKSEKRGVKPYLQKDIMAEREWKLLMVPFKVGSEEERVKVAFFMGGAKPQELQFANVTVFDFKKNYKFEDLPQSKTYYPGMELDAPWRKEADARIEKYRKATLDVTVENGEGKALEGAKVHIKQLRHEFGFGAAISARVMFDKEKGDEEDQRMYKQRILESFNKVTIENGLKWKLFEHFEPFIQPTLDWCKANELPVRGHVLVWPGYGRLPKGYDTYKTNPQQFKKDIEDHVRDFSTRWGDFFPEWDVMNEPYSQHDYMDLLGKEVTVDWFNIAKESNPNFVRYINDYAILAGNNHEHIQNYHEWIQYLLDNKAPVQAIGFQSHFRSPTPPMEIWRRIKEFEKYGLEMQVTEYDFDDEDEELKVRFTEDFMTLIFSHPKFVGFVTWTITWHNTKYSGKKNATFYREDWSKKPVAERWDYLVKEKWHTDVNKVSDKNGKLSFRGFKGKYRITIEHNGAKKVQEIYLKKDGKGTLVLN